MSQEIDRSETLQAKGLGAQQSQTVPSQVQTTEVVVVVGQMPAAEARDLTKVSAATRAPWASRHAKQAYAKSWLHGDKRQPIQVAIGPRV